MKRFYFVLIMLHASAFGIFERDSASVLAQKEEWQQANDALQKLVVQHHDNPDLLYDAGVTSFKTGAFDQAHAYFQNVKDHEATTAALQEQAYFNLGNTCVELNKLEEAIEQYQAALDINTENEWAQHNLERVKEMLRQQQQQEQEQQQNQNQQNQDQNQGNQQNNDQQNQQEQDKNQDQQSQEQNKQENDSKGEQQDQQGNDSEDDQQNKSDQNQSEQGEQQNKDGDQQSESTQGKHQQRDADSGADQQRQEQQEQGEQQDTEKNKEGNRNQKAEQDFKENKPDQKQDKKLDHPFNPAQNKMNQQSLASQDQDTQEDEKTQREQIMAGSDDENDDPKDPWLVRLLQEREKSDKKATKQIMKATIDNQLAGKDGQNCW